jgi:hypothetical protein
MNELVLKLLIGVSSHVLCDDELFDLLVVSLEILDSYF